MTPHEGPSDTLPEHPARLESASAPVRDPLLSCAAVPKGHFSPPVSLLIPAPAAIMGMYTDWGNLKVVSCVAWLNWTDPAAQRCNREWAHWGRPLSG
jgi:hypothetical protein